MAFTSLLILHILLTTTTTTITTFTFTVRRRRGLGPGGFGGLPPSSSSSRPLHSAPILLFFIAIVCSHCPLFGLSLLLSHLALLLLLNFLLCLFCRARLSLDFVLCIKWWISFLSSRWWCQPIGICCTFIKCEVIEIDCTTSMFGKMFDWPKHRALVNWDLHAINNSYYLPEMLRYLGKSRDHFFAS